MRRLFALSLAAFVLGAQAQKPPAKPEPRLEPLPGPTDAVDEPRVRIPVQEGDEVEPVRQGGQVVALRVKPKNGPAYYLVDTSGRGGWMRRESLDDGLRVPMFPIKTWD